MRKSANEEKNLTNEAGQQTPGLIVSGDGTWMKRGFSSLFGVASLIGFRTKKVIDVIIKSAYCHACKMHENDPNDIEHEMWRQEHAKDCVSNHKGASGKMEVDAICEMFLRSEELYGTQYTHYIGDGDSKTYKSIVVSKPYGDKTIIKKECINHVQKRMGTRLRQIKKTHKGLSGRGKLTDKIINELSNYYGKAIRENNKSVKQMRDAIWATIYHKRSSDENPDHDLCPEGVRSWCTWQRAKATGKLQGYKHKQPLPKNVVDAIIPVYTDLSKAELLERCIGGFTQNCNESFNALIWKFAPKTTSSRAIIVKIATYLAVCIYNNGMSSLLQVLDAMQVKIGPQMYSFCRAKDQHRTSQTAARSLTGRIKNKSEDNQRVNRPSTSTEDHYYGPGIDELW